MDKPLDNANPTILSVSQLPSRKQKKTSSPRKAPESELERLLFALDDELEPPWLKKNKDYGVGDIDYEALAAADEPIDEQEIYDLISTIADPEHPHTLGQLSVVNLPDIHITRAPDAVQPPPATVEEATNINRRLTRVLVEITPTITHCSLATVIGLAVRVRLERALPSNWRVDVRVKAGTHQQGDQVDKQLADKERVAAALENDSLVSVLDRMMETCVR